MDNITILFASYFIIKQGLHLNILRCNPQSSYAKQSIFTTIPANLHVSYPPLSNLLHQDLQLPPYYLKALYIFPLRNFHF